MICFFFLLALSATALTQQSIFEQAVGPCIRGQCQSGFGCLYGQCIPSPDRSRGIGPCVGGSCPQGAFCLQGECFQ